MKKTLPFLHHKVQETQFLNSKDQYSAGSFAVRPFPPTHPFVHISQSLSTEGDTLLERFDFSRLHSKKDYFLWLCCQLPRENLQAVSGLCQNWKRPTWAGSCLPTSGWVCGVGSHGCHLTTGPGKGKVGLATGCQRLAINPCHCWVPTAMWSSSKMPHGWKWGTWEGSTWPLETAKNLCMASSRSLKGKAGCSFELITCFTHLTC